MFLKSEFLYQLLIRVIYLLKLIVSVGKRTKFYILNYSEIDLSAQKILQD